jgi:hypothetical protein
MPESSISNDDNSENEDEISGSLDEEDLEGLAI